MRRRHLGKELLRGRHLMVPVRAAAGGAACPQLGTDHRSGDHLLERDDRGLARGRACAVPEQVQPARSTPSLAPAPPGAPPRGLPLSRPARPLRRPLDGHPGRERGEGEVAAGMRPAVGGLPEPCLAATVCRAPARCAAEAGRAAGSGDDRQNSAAGVTAQSIGVHFVTHCGTGAPLVQVCATHYR